MALQFVTDLSALTAALQRYMMVSGASLPEHAREALIEFAGHPSPVDRIVNSAEALYAIKADLDSAGADLTAQLAQFAAVNGWHGMGQRGMEISAAMQRINGYEPPAGTSWPAAAFDPEPLAKFLPPLATTEPEGNA